jgi:CheY-like chemotaxis protein/HPt (histidine-containing phosphotransfer) domain-containing protein
MDIQMPIMDGEEATQRIRAELPQYRQPYIIALTADALEGRREFYLEVGMDDYLSKPMGIDHLVKAIDHYWAVKELAASSALTPAVIAVEVLDKAIIDREIANEWIQAIGSRASFSAVVDGFLENSTHLVKDIEEHYAARDWISLKMVCHGLKSSSDSMGATQLSILLGTLEDLSDSAKNGLVNDEKLIIGLFAQIQKAHVRTCDELRLLQVDLMENSKADGKLPPLAGHVGKKQ